jgi:hypothetical protein
MNAAGFGLRPDKTATLKTLRIKVHAVGALPQNLNNVATPSTKGKNVARKLIKFESGLNNSGKAVHAATHVRDASGHPIRVPEGGAIIRASDSAALNAIERGRPYPWAEQARH